MEKGTVVTYIDSFGVEHEALVTALNGLNPGFVTVVYIDDKAPEAENVVKKFDVPHMSDPSKDETNPNLPRYVVNAWKEAGEYHLAPPADHPAFDHPFAVPAVDQDGVRIPVTRPQYFAEVNAHQASGQPSAEDLDAVAKEQEATAATAGVGAMGAANPAAVDKLKAALASFPQHHEPDVTTQLDQDKSADSDATGTK